MSNPEGVNQSAKPSGLFYHQNTSICEKFVDGPGCWSPRGCNKRPNGQGQCRGNVMGHEQGLSRARVKEYGQ